MHQNATSARRSSSESLPGRAVSNVLRNVGTARAWGTHLAQKPRQEPCRIVGIAEELRRDAHRREQAREQVVVVLAGVGEVAAVRDAEAGAARDDEGDVVVAVGGALAELAAPEDGRVVEECAAGFWDGVEAGQ